MLLKHNNGHIKSSALANLENGIKTELACVVEELTNYSEKSNIDIPSIRKVYSMIKEIESGKRQISEDVFKKELII